MHKHIFILKKCTIDMKIKRQLQIQINVCCPKNAVSFMEVCIGQRNAASFMVHVCMCVVTKTLSRLWKCV